jgi:hypothetical protein
VREGEQEGRGGERKERREKEEGDGRGVGNKEGEAVEKNGRG